MLFEIDTMLKTAENAIMNHLVARLLDEYVDQALTTEAKQSPIFMEFNEEELGINEAA